MNAVNFVIEFSDLKLFIEFMDLQHPQDSEQKIEEFDESFLNSQVVDDLGKGQPLGPDLEIQPKRLLFPYGTIRKIGCSYIPLTLNPVQGQAFQDFGV